MDINQWKNVLFDWIKATELIDIFGTIEHIHLDEYFDKFYHKIHDKPNDSTITTFLKEIYPDYEILNDETNNISSQDYVYIFSLLLHYSCVRESNHFFQIACTKLNNKYQLLIANFLQYIDQNNNVTKETLRTGIKHATEMMSPVETKYFSANSPLRTPKKSDISPPTPSKEFVHSKLTELKLIKTQLENERFERNALETEVKQTQEQIESLVKKCRDLNHELQSLKVSKESTDNDSENVSPNKIQRDGQIRRKLQKELQNREDLITDLKNEVETTNEINRKYQEKIRVLEKQMNEMRLKMRELDASIEDLICNMDLKDQKIHTLEEERKELLEFIHESRSNSAHGKDVSSDFLDFSCSTSLYTTTCNDSGEILAKSVIDVLLKEKESEIIKLNELLATANSTKEAMEMKITDLLTSLKNLENELSDTKNRKIKIFEEKSAEIQVLQNQLNSSESKNRELQREIELKHKINLKMLAEGDAHKTDLDVQQKEIDDLVDQKKKHEEEILKLQLELKDITSNKKLEEKNLKQHVEILRAALEAISSKTKNFDECIQQKIETINNKLQEKESKILELKVSLQNNKTNFNLCSKQSEERLALKTTELSLLNAKYLKLEEQQVREKIFNDKLSDDNEILKAKLHKERTERSEEQKRHEQEIEDLKNEKLRYRGEMERKLEGYKAEMITKYKNSLAENETKMRKLENENNNLRKQDQEKNGVLEKYNLLISKLQNEIESLENITKDKDNVIKKLTLDVKEEKREKEFLQSKLRFVRENGIDDIQCLEATSSAPCIQKEKFNDIFRSQLENGLGFDSPFTCRSSIFQERNSRYPMHMRDSYAICKTDKDLTEYEMKFGLDSNDSQVSPTRKKKQHTMYHKPGPSTPSKNGRLTMNPESKILKDTTNTEHVEKKNTPVAKLKAMFFGKQKHEIRSLTPKRIKNQPDRWVIEKDTTDSDENIKCTIKVKELDRKGKREKARDLNRPNLIKDEALDSSDSEWIEDSIEEDKNYERHSNTSNQHDKSLEYIKKRERFRNNLDKKRRRSFNKNRRSSILKNANRRSIDDWDKYKSCTSLSESTANFNTTLLNTPKKSYTMNFLDTHIAEVKRLSDYYVPSKNPSCDLKDSTEKFFTINFKDVQIPFRVVIAMITIVFIVFFTKYFNRTTTATDIKYQILPND